MISLVSVFLRRLSPFFDIFLESVVNNLKLVDEVIMPCGDCPLDYYESWEERGIKFVKFGSPQKITGLRIPTGGTQCLDHALNLHEGIDRAKNDYVLLSDPDVFFYGATDEFYINLIEKYKLNYIGVSHPASITQAFTYFPNVLNCMGKRSEFPGEDFLKDKFYLDYIFPNEFKGYHISLAGKFLSPGPLRETAEQFPNPTGHFETGCNMLLWANQNKWRWLSFQTGDCFQYTSQYYRSTVKVDRLPRTKIIYHATNSCVNPSSLKQFRQAYNEYKETQSD